ncbi:RNA polymerase sigma factor [Halosquirtibacter xylanolyticus]|uniref:RNA polymerase sigma factor n=1 Tax=Halosquirtibacter xylanolyticus TaxID=3374599 RepID=UPI00374955CC|nr:RNA polymerase sigma factor [Prolixibacteraceae bacterium]
MKQEFLDKISEHQKIIHKVCSVYCVDSEARKDLFQEILVQLWRAYPSFKGEAKFSTWMYRVAFNTAITYFKKEKRNISTQSIENEVFHVTDDGRDEEFEARVEFLHRAIGTLSSIEKSIILLYLEEKKYDEISEIMGITQNNVRVKMSRIKDKLRKIMNPS